MVITGAVVSITETTCVEVAELPEVSVTVQVTVVSPNPKDCGASLVTDATSTTSYVLGSPNGTTFPDVPTASKTTFAGAVIIGLVVSTIVTFCVLDTEFPKLSVAVQVTIVVPRG